MAHGCKLKAMSSENLIYHLTVDNLKETVLSAAEGVELSKKLLSDKIAGYEMYNASKSTNAYATIRANARQN